MRLTRLLPFALLGSSIAIPAPASAQAAGECVRADTPPPRVAGDTTLNEFHEDLRHGAVFRCMLGRGRVLTRLVVRADEGGTPTGLEVYAPHGAARPAQRLAVKAIEPPRRGRDFVEAVDLNADGWLDLMVMIWWGATGNTGYDVFLYDPAARRFARSAALSDRSNPEPVAGRACVSTHSVGGSGGLVYSRGEFCWRGGTWVRVRDESQAWDEARSTRRTAVYVRTIRVRRGGRMRTVSVRTIREPIE